MGILLGGSCSMNVAICFVTLNSRVINMNLFMRNDTFKVNWKKIGD